MYYNVAKYARYRVARYGLAGPTPNWRRAPGSGVVRVVSSKALPPGVGKPASLTGRSLHLRPLAGQGDGQGNGQGCHWGFVSARCAIVRQYPF